MPPLSWKQISPEVWVLGYKVHNWEDPIMTITLSGEYYTLRKGNESYGVYKTLEGAKESADRWLNQMV